VIEIARGKPDGFTTHWGKHIPAHTLRAWDLHPNDRRRVKPAAGAGTDSWFRFDVGVPCQEVALSIRDHLNQADEFWNIDRQIG